ncbi:MAG: polyprenyl synthetase family protein [Thermoguttaceae bacterium]
MPSKLSHASFAEIAKQLGPRIDAALDAQTQLNHDCPARLREAMRYSLLAPGKRLRPMLVLLAARACGGDTEAAMPAACAVEIVHAYSLIHDDLPAMDDDDLRRGRPTCHKAFDEATAILAGDALLTLAFETLAHGVKPPAVAAACCAVLAKAAGPCGMVGGQTDDVAAEKNDECGMMNDECERDRQASAIHHSSLIIHHSLPHLESIHRRKTGAMILVSLRLGAMTAGAVPEQLATLDAYGQRLGLAFQIIDDLLDVQSSEAATGKRVGKDAQRGKLTFPGLLGLDQSAQHARELISEASEALELFGEDADGLRAVAHFVLERNR